MTLAVCVLLYKVIFSTRAFRNSLARMDLDRLAVAQSDSENRIAEIIELHDERDPTAVPPRWLESIRPPESETCEMTSLRIKSSIQTYVHGVVESLRELATPFIGGVKSNESNSTTASPATPADSSSFSDSSLSYPLLNESDVVNELSGTTATPHVGCESNNFSVATEPAVFVPRSFVGGTVSALSLLLFLSYIIYLCIQYVGTDPAPLIPVAGRSYNLFDATVHARPLQSFVPVPLVSILPNRYSGGISHVAIFQFQIANMSSAANSQFYPLPTIQQRGSDNLTICVQGFVSTQLGNFTVWSWHHEAQFSPDHVPTNYDRPCPLYSFSLNTMISNGVLSMAAEVNQQRVTDRVIPLSLRLMFDRNHGSITTVRALKISLVGSRYNAAKSLQTDAPSIYTDRVMWCNSDDLDATISDYSAELYPLGDSNQTVLSVQPVVRMLLSATLPDRMFFGIGYPQAVLVSGGQGEAGQRVTGRNYIGGVDIGTLDTMRDMTLVHDSSSGTKLTHTFVLDVFSIASFAGGLISLQPRVKRLATFVLTSDFARWRSRIFFTTVYFVVQIAMGILFSIPFQTEDLRNPDNTFIYIDSITNKTMTYSNNLFESGIPFGGYSDTANFNSQLLLFFNLCVAVAFGLFLFFQLCVLLKELHGRWLYLICTAHLALMGLSCWLLAVWWNYWNTFSTRLQTNTRTYASIPPKYIQIPLVLVSIGIGLATLVRLAQLWWRGDQIASGGSDNFEGALSHEEHVA